MRQTELVDSAAPGQASVLCHGWLHAPRCSNLVEQQKPWRPCLAGNPSRYNALETDGAPEGMNLGTGLRPFQSPECLVSTHFATLRV